MIDRLDRLRHDGIVGRHDKHHDVRDLRAPCPHGRERRVAGSVQERQDRIVPRRDLVGAYVLRDAASLASSDLGVANCVKKRGFSVINMAHDRDDGRPRTQIVVPVLNRVDDVLDVRIGHPLNAVPEGLDDELGRVRVDRLVLGGHDPVRHQCLDDIGDAFRHSVRQFADHDRFGKLHCAHDLFAFLRAPRGLLACTLLLSPHCGKRALPAAFAAGKRLVQRQLSLAPSANGPRAPGPIVAARLPFLPLLTLRCGLAASTRRRRLRRRRLLCSSARPRGLGLLALLFLRLCAGLLRPFLFLALLGNGLGLASLPLFGTCLLRGRALFGIGSLRRLGSGQRLHAPLELRIRYSSWPVGRVRRLNRRHLRLGCLLGSARSGNDNPLALRLDHDVLCPAM